MRRGEAKTHNPNCLRAKISVVKWRVIVRAKKLDFGTKGQFWGTIDRSALFSYVYISQ